MTHGRPRRWAAALVALTMATTLVVLGTPGAASADGTRTITGTTTCTSGIIPYGFQVNYGTGWTGADSSYISNYYTKVWTKVIPSSATSIALDSGCYVNWQEYYGYVYYPYGTWVGYTYSLTPGTSTVNTTWSCSRNPVYPGPPVERSCSLTAISYG
jgi:hypothetical protein